MSAHPLKIAFAQLHSIQHCGIQFYGILLCVSIMPLVFVGCDEPDAITSYTIPTTVPAQLKADKQRMLAAMVPSGDQVWFFKVTGPESAIDSIDDTFRQFVEQIEIIDGVPVLDSLPEGWRRGGEKAMRYASIDVDTPAKQLDISISKLVRQEDWDAMVAMNVNRWRGQLGLEASKEKWAEGESLKVAAADAPGIWVDLIGDSASTSMTPPFAGGGPFAPGDQMRGASRSAALPPMAPPPSIAAPSEPAEPMEPDSRLKFDRPEGWRDGRMSSMRMAAFNVGPEEAAAEITVIPAGGDLRGNVARWLGQARGDQAPDEVVDQAMEAAQEVTVDGRDGNRFFLTAGKDAGADDTAIDATIVPLDGGMSLFIKMTGPQATVQDQSEQITEFLKSLKLKL